MCNPHRLTWEAASGCLVYSIGSNGDSSFETAIHDSISPSCEIHAFDVRPWHNYTTVQMPKFMNYHTQLIGSLPPAKSIPEIVRDLNHTGRKIDILKIDCEGCDILDTGVLAWFEVDIRMILVNVHVKERVPSEFARIRRFFTELQFAGVIYHKEPGYVYRCGGGCYDFAFKLHPDF